MTRSSSSFLFPDVNVWIALSWQGHIHHSAAVGWFAGISDDERLCFCRITQLSFLRLLTTSAVVGSDVRSQAEAWQAYDHWLDDPRVIFLDEPEGLEQVLRSHSRQRVPAPKDWADAYLLSFALVAGLSLVTFDRAFRSKTSNLVVLGQ